MYRSIPPLLNFAKVDVELHHSAFFAFADAFDLSEGELGHALVHIGRPLGCFGEFMREPLPLDLDRLAVYFDIGVLAGRRLQSPLNGRFGLPVGGFFPSPARKENEKGGKAPDCHNNCRNLHYSHSPSIAAKPDRGIDEMHI